MYVVATPEMLKSVLLTEKVKRQNELHTKRHYIILHVGRKRPKRVIDWI